MAMKGRTIFRLCAIATVSLGFLPPASSRLRAQEKPKRETIQAQAMGQNTAASKNFNLTITIESYSAPEDQKVLLDAFAQGGQDALVKALGKMKSEGRIAITGTLGYGVAYVRNIPGEDGRTIRLMTDRPIQIPEARQSRRSKNYDISALELNLKNDKNRVREF